MRTYHLSALGDQLGSTALMDGPALFGRNVPNFPLTTKMGFGTLSFTH